MTTSSSYQPFLQLSWHKNQTEGKTKVVAAIWIPFSGKDDLKKGFWKNIHFGKIFSKTKGIFWKSFLVEIVMSCILNVFFSSSSLNPIYIQMALIYWKNLRENIFWTSFDSKNNRKTRDTSITWSYTRGGGCCRGTPARRTWGCWRRHRRPGSATGSPNRTPAGIVWQQVAPTETLRE